MISDFGIIVTCFIILPGVSINENILMSRIRKHPITERKNLIFNITCSLIVSNTDIIYYFIAPNKKCVIIVDILLLCFTPMCYVCHYFNTVFCFGVVTIQIIWT